MNTNTRRKQQNLDKLVAQCRDAFMSQGATAERVLRRSIVRRRRMPHHDALSFCIRVMDAVLAEKRNNRKWGQD